MKFFALALALIFSLASSTAGQANEGSHRIEPALAGRKDVLLFCDFETDDWWRAWGMQKPPANTSLVDGEEAFKGKSLKVTVRRDEHMGTSFAYKFRQQTGAEPEEIYFRYYLKFDPNWRNATSGGKLPESVCPPIPALRHPASQVRPIPLAARPARAVLWHGWKECGQNVEERE